MKKIFAAVLTAVIMVSAVLPLTALAAVTYHIPSEKTTGVMDAPVVCEYIDTAEKYSALGTEKAPETAIFKVNSSLKVVINKKSYTVSEAYKKCGSTVLPLFYASGKTLSSLESYINKNKLYDVVIGSDDCDALKKISQSRYTHKAYFTGLISDENSKERILLNARKAGAGMVFMHQNGLTRKTVEYFRKRLLQVYINNDGQDVSTDTVLCLGADGMVTLSASKVYSELANITENVYYKRFFISAHRAYNMLAPENSVEAMELARDGGADYIELDVCPTADGELAVHHNITVTVDINYMNANGMPIELPSNTISELTMEELKKIYLPAVGDYTECRIPTLDEYLTAFKEKQSDAVLFLEMKSNDIGVCRQTAELIEKYDLSLDTVVFSFDFDVAAKFNQYNVGVGKMILTSWYTVARYEGKQTERLNELLKALSVNMCEGISTSADCMTKEDVRLFAARGISVNMWTVNEYALMEELYDRGVDSVTSDIAPVVIEENSFPKKLSASFMKDPEPIELPKPPQENEDENKSEGGTSIFTEDESEPTKEGEEEEELFDESDDTETPEDTEEAEYKEQNGLTNKEDAKNGHLVLFIVFSAVSVTAAVLLAVIMIKRVKK